MQNVEYSVLLDKPCILVKNNLKSLILRHSKMLSRAFLAFCRFLRVQISIGFPMASGVEPAVSFIT